MKNNLYSVVGCVFVAFVFVFMSCSKMESPVDNGRASVLNLSSKISQWIKKQQNANKSSSSNVLKLTQNLRLDDLTSENTINHERLIIVPIDEKYKVGTPIDAKSRINLVVFLDKNGEVKTASINVFMPKNPGQSNILPANTFSNIFSSSASVPDGEYKFLAVTGPRMLQLSYSDGQLRSSGSFKTKPKNGTIAAFSAPGCIDWYLVTTWYHADGTTTQEWDYITTTCGSCFNGIDYVPCRENGGNGGSGDQGTEEREEQITVNTNGNSDTEVDGVPDGGVSPLRYYPPIFFYHNAKVFSTYVLGTGEKFISRVEISNTLFIPAVAGFTDSWSIEGVRTITQLSNANSWTPLIPATSCYIQWTSYYNSSYVTEDGRAWTSGVWSHHAAKIHTIP